MYKLESVTIAYYGYELKRYSHLTIKDAGKYEIIKLLTDSNHKVIASVEFAAIEGIEAALKQLKKEYIHYINSKNIPKLFNVVKRWNSHKPN